jgi:hypothetical protein
MVYWWLYKVYWWVHRAYWKIHRVYWWVHISNIEDSSISISGGTSKWALRMCDWKWRHRKWRYRTGNNVPGRRFCGCQEVSVFPRFFSLTIVVGISQATAQQGCPQGTVLLLYRQVINAHPNNCVHHKDLIEVFIFHKWPKTIHCLSRSMQFIKPTIQLCVECFCRSGRKIQLLNVFGYPCNLIKYWTLFLPFFFSLFFQIVSILCTSSVLMTFYNSSA